MSYQAHDDQFTQAVVVAPGNLDLMCLWSVFILGMPRCPPNLVYVGETGWQKIVIGMPRFTLLVELND